MAKGTSLFRKRPANKRTSTSTSSVRTSSDSSVASSEVTNVLFCPQSNIIVSAVSRGNPISDMTIRFTCNPYVGGIEQNKQMEMEILHSI